MLKLPPAPLHPVPPVTDQFPVTVALVRVVEVFGGVPVTVAVPVRDPVRVSVFPPELTVYVSVPVTVSFVFTT
jgi:hypothetical protein